MISALPQRTDITQDDHYICLGPILLQKSKIERRQKSRESRCRHEASWSFSAKRCSLTSRDVGKFSFITPKKTFATKSASCGSPPPSPMVRKSRARCLPGKSGRHLLLRRRRLAISAVNPSTCPFLV